MVAYGPVFGETSHRCPSSPHSPGFHPMDAASPVDGQRLVFSEFDQSQLGRYMLEQSDVLVFILGADGLIRYANPVVQQRLGLEPKDLVGLDFFAALSTGVESARLARLVKAKTPLLPAHARIELRGPRGAAHSFFCTASFSPEGQGREIVLMARPAGEISSRTLLAEDSAALALFQNAPHAIFLHEPALGRVLQANTLALNLACCELQDLLGRDMQELLPFLSPLSLEAATAGQGIDTSLRARSGRLTPVSVTTSRVELDGRVRFLSFVRDLSVERRAETERMASEARFKMALDRLMDGFCLLAPRRDGAGEIEDFRFSYANPAAREALLIPAGETDRATLSGVFAASTAQSLRDVFATVMRSGRDVNFDRIRLEQPARAAVFALHVCKHGEGVAISLRDETERAGYEQALAGKERSLSALLAHLPVGVFYVDLGAPQSPILNQSAMDLLGSGPETLDYRTCGRGLLADLAGNPLPDEQLPFNRLLRHPSAYRNDGLQLIRPGHSPVRLDIAVSPLRDESGRLAAMVAVFNDITRRVALEAQLSQSQRMQALGTLAGGIAHDFNNVAQAISGSLELAKRSLDSGHSAYGNICAAQKAASRVTSLTAQLLSASKQRLEAAQTADAAPLIEETAMLLRGTIDKRIEIVVEVAKDCWPAVLEPGRLQQSLLNLALNARDAIEGNGVIAIKARNVTFTRDSAELHLECEPGDYVAIAVSDTGVGMPPEIMARIFEPFFSTKPVGKGSGLGLSVVYANMRQVGGWVGVASGRQGTTFTLYFRRGQGSVQRQEREEGPPEPAGTRGGHEHILIVDDEPEILEIAGEILTDTGYRVETAQDGVGALERLRRQPDIDLVLLDLTMPRMNGADAIKAIREESLAPCVVAMSGFASGLDTDDLIKLGADAFLPKPYSLSQLTRVVREQLDLHPRRKA
ncbi:response regulator [bacterium]|nr:MAG: response regulator [bacterium]